MRATGRAPQETMRTSPLAAHGATPHCLESSDHVACGGSFNDDCCVPPARAMLLEHPGCPFATNADAAGYAYCLVDNEELAVIAWNEAEPGAEAGMVEDLDVDAGANKLANECTRGAPRADPIQEEP